MKILKPLMVIMVLAISLSSCKKESLDTEFSSDMSSGLYTISEIQNLFEEKKPIDWTTEKDVKFVHSVAIHTDSIVAVGYKPSYLSDLSESMNTIDINSNEWKEVEEKIVNLVLEEEGKGKDLVIVREATKLPVIVIKVGNLSTIRKLKELSEVRYVQPLNSNLFSGGVVTREKDPRSTVPTYDPHGKLGCNKCNTPTQEPSEDDYTPIFPNNIKEPWNYFMHRIHSGTWEISNGSGIGVAIIDSGVSLLQENLEDDEMWDGTQGTFNSGWSMGRSETRKNFLHYKLDQDGREVPMLPSEFSPHDFCGHGTRMAGLVAAPRGLDQNTLGVAYNCNLYNLRAVHNPFINTSKEEMAVVDALLFAADEPDIKIISMSLGMYPDTWSPMIKDAIAIAWLEGKMIVCAAGSNVFNWPIFPVLFPANDPNTVAVTGIKKPSNWPNGPLDNTTWPCAICHSGEEVDYAVIMEKEFGGTSTLTVACDGDIPEYSTGSSAATATFAGMAALVWAHDGGNRESVLSRINLASSNYPFEHPSFGYGYLDLELALY